MDIFTTFYHFETLFTTYVEKMAVMNIVSNVKNLYTKIELSVKKSIYTGIIDHQNFKIRMKKWSNFV